MTDAARPRTLHFERRAQSTERKNKRDCGAEIARVKEPAGFGHSRVSQFGHKRPPGRPINDRQSVVLSYFNASTGCVGDGSTNVHWPGSMWPFRSAARRRFT